MKFCNVKLPILTFECYLRKTAFQMLRKGELASDQGLSLSWRLVLKLSTERVYIDARAAREKRRQLLHSTIFIDSHSQTTFVLPRSIYISCKEYLNHCLNMTNGWAMDT